MRALVEQNAGKEKEALGKLSSDEKKQYETLRSQVEDSPSATMALQLLLTEGTLRGDKKNAENDTLLGALSKLSNQDLAEGIEKKDLLKQLVREIANPSVINQQNKGTCGATTLQILMTMEQPAELARLIGGLASPEGQVKLANGDTIQREEGTEKSDGSHRTISARLWAPTIMEYANGASIDYDNDRDLNTGDPRFPDGWEGLDDSEIMHAMAGLTGNTPTKVNTKVDPKSLSAIQEALKNGNHVPVFIVNQSHYVLLTKIENGQAYFNNPWGEEDHMPLEQFKVSADLGDFNNLKVKK